MQDEFIQDMTKKDPDFKMIIDEDDSSITTINTTIKNIDDIVEDFLIPIAPEIIEENIKNTTVYIKIIQTIFLMNVVVSFMIMYLGAIPYFLFLHINEERNIPILISFSVLCFISYLFLAFFKSKSWLAVFILFFSLLMGIVSAVVDDVAPLQVSTIFFAQSLSIVVYTRFSKRKIKIWFCLLLMILSGLCAWTLGIYAFIKEQDWISAIVILIILLIFAIYSTIQIKYCKDYSLSETHLTHAIVDFFCDPLYFFLCWKCK